MFSFTFVPKATSMVSCLDSDFETDSYVYKIIHDTPVACNEGFPRNCRHYEVKVGSLMGKL